MDTTKCNKKTKKIKAFNNDNAPDR